MQQCARDREHDDVVSLTVRSFCVDDFVSSFPTVEIARDMIDDDFRTLRK